MNLKKVVFTVVLLFISNLCFAFPIRNAEVKQKLIMELDQCFQERSHVNPFHCRPLAQSILQKNLSTEDLVKSAKGESKGVILYFHSFSLSPNEYHNPINNYQSKHSDYDYVSLCWTAHCEDFKENFTSKVKGSDWILDSELYLKIASALQPNVILTGFSLGGLLATHQAISNPGMIQKMILIAPAFMIASGAENAACSGRNGFLRSVATSFTGDTPYIRNFLIAACAVSQTTKIVRKDKPSSSNGGFSGYGENSNSSNENEFYERIEAVKQLAKKLQTPTYIIYGRDDEAVDSRAIEAFVQNSSKIESEFYFTTGSNTHMKISLSTTTGNNSRQRIAASIENDIFN